MRVERDAYSHARSAPRRRCHLQLPAKLRCPLAHEAEPVAAIPSDGYGARFEAGPIVLDREAQRPVLASDQDARLVRPAVTDRVGDCLVDDPQQVGSRLGRDVGALGRGGDGERRGDPVVSSRGVEPATEDGEEVNEVGVLIVGRRQIGDGMAHVRLGFAGDPRDAAQPVVGLGESTV